MGKLIHSYSAGPEIVTKPHWDPQTVGKKHRTPTRKFITHRIRTSTDASDFKYEMVDGIRRRKPETLPAKRRLKTRTRRKAA